jgi:hypothetical protein
MVHQLNAARANFERNTLTMHSVTEDFLTINHDKLISQHNQFSEM